MSINNWPTRIALYSDRSDRKALLINTFNSADSCCEVRQIGLNNAANQTTLRADIVLLDCSETDTQTFKRIRRIVRRHREKSGPLLLITNPNTEDLLESDAIDGIAPLSFSPFSLPGLAFNLRHESRASFLTRLSRLNKYGTLAVRLPQSELCRDKQNYRETA